MCKYFGKVDIAYNMKNTNHSISWFYNINQFDFFRSLEYSIIIIQKGLTNVGPFESCRPLAICISIHLQIVGRTIYTVKFVRFDRLVGECVTS